jgi:hypothetical protein
MRTGAPARAAAIGAVAGLVLSVSGCGESEAARANEEGMVPTADESVCRADATPLPAPYGRGFPEDWPFPPLTTVYHFEDRGEDGRIVTATSAAGFGAVLSFMNHQVVHAGFRIESGETEDHDAEAEWEGNGYRGRWAIRESGSCPGETVIQVLAGDAE